MSEKIQKWTKRHRVATIVILALLVVTAALVARPVNQATPQPVPAVNQPQSAAVRLAAPLPPSAAVFIQRTTSSYGNVLLTVQLTQAQIDAKRQDGTADFINLGDTSAP